MYAIIWLDNDGNAHTENRERRLSAARLITSIETFENLMGIGVVADTDEEIADLIKVRLGRVPFAKESDKTMFPMGLRRDGSLVVKLPEIHAYASAYMPIPQGAEWQGRETDRRSRP